MNKFNSCAMAMTACLLLAMSSVAEAPAPRFSAATLYNQANAYARAGQFGMAVLHYERAQLLAPGDRDIEANLNAVRRAQHLVVEPRSWVQRFAVMQSPSCAALTGLLGLLIVGAAILAGAFTHRRGAAAVAATLGMVLMAVTAEQAALLWPSLKAGVIIAHEAPVRESPVPMGEALFVLPEAETVTVTAQHEDFLLIQTRTGKVGWVWAANLVRVVADEAAAPR